MFITAILRRLFIFYETLEGSFLSFDAIISLFLGDFAFLVVTLKVFVRKSMILYIMLLLE
jgi:hypothetical protein